MIAIAKAIAGTATRIRRVVSPLPPRGDGLFSVCGVFSVAAAL